MSLFLLPICYILRNGMTVDDLGLVLVGGAVLILMIRLTCRAVVNIPIFFFFCPSDF
jgi:hypothetical protein